MNDYLCPRKKRAYKILADKINNYFGLNESYDLTSKKLQELSIEAFNEASR